MSKGSTINVFLFFHFPHFAITSDGWSKPTHSPRLQSVTIHWIDSNFIRNDAVLGAFPMDEFCHTGEVIAEEIANCMRENGLSLDKLVCCVRDDARNMQSANRQLEKDSFQCCCHFLNLVVHDALKKISKAKEWTKECPKPKIKKCMERHQEQSNLPKKQLNMSVPTRWNSTYRMLAAFKEQKKVLLAMQFERDQRNAGILSVPKRPRLAEMEIISSSLPSISSQDFEVLRQICPGAEHSSHGLKSQFDRRRNAFLLEHFGNVVGGKVHLSQHNVNW